MNHDASSNSENANLTNDFRQKYINLQGHPNDDEIKVFLKQSLKYLKQDLTYIEVNELFNTILACFSLKSKFFISFFPHLFKRSRSNSNFIILTAITISDIIHSQPEITVPDYSSFVNDAINEILPQIGKIEENSLEIFGHIIPPYFNNRLIISLLLVYELADKIFLSFFSYFYHHNLLSYDPKINLLLQNITKSGTISIAQQNETSCDEINEFIKQNGIYSISNMCIQSISLIESAAIFIKCQEKKRIKGLKKETILQFLSVLIIIMKNYQIEDKVKFSAKALLDLFLEGVKYLEINESPVLNTSIDLILSNYFYINSTFSTPPDTLVKMFDILLQQLIKNRYKADKMVLFLNIFDLSNKIIYFNFRDPVLKFFEKNENELFILIIQHLKTINSDYRFKQTKLNLEFIDQDLFFNKITYYEIIYFLKNSCCNLSKEKLKNSTDHLIKVLEFKIRNKLMDEASFICQFMKENELKFEEPIDLVEKQFNCELLTKESENDLLDHIVKHSNPEQTDILFRSLFSKMNQDKDILHNHLFYLLSNKYDINGFPLDSFLSIFYVEYSLYKDDFFDAIKNMYVYKIEEKTLIHNLNFEIESFKPKDSAIITRLFAEIDSKPNNYQAFYCLMSIASSFPFLFKENIKEVYERVFPSIEYISFIFDQRKDDESLTYIKTAYSALHFLASTLQSSTILDNFYQYVFQNILTFSDIQVFCVFIILNMLNQDKNLLIPSQALIINYHFLDTISKLLKREIKEGFFKFSYKNNIYKFIKEIYSFYMKCDIYAVTQIDELKKSPTPVLYYYNNILSNFPHINKELINIDSTHPDDSNDSFIDNIQLKKFFSNTKRQRDFWLSFNFDQLRFKQSNEDLLQKFLLKVDKVTSGPGFIKLPEINRPLSLHMVRFIVMQKIWIYHNILFFVKVPITNEMFKYYSQIINDINKLRTYADNHPEYEEEADINQFAAVDYLLPLYCQESLIESLMNDVSTLSINILDKRNISTLSELFTAYISYDITLFTFFSIVSNFFSNICKKSIGYATPSSLNAMCNLIDILSELMNVKNFKKYFFEACGNNLINIILSPELRCDPKLLQRIASLLTLFDEFPMSILQLIRFMFLLKNEQVTLSALTLCSKFTHDQLQELNQLILDIFDYEIEHKKRLTTIMNFIEYYPPLIELRSSTMLSILKGMFQKFSYHKLEKLDTLCMILNILCPSRKDFNIMSTQARKISKVPQHIKESSPQFWNIIESNMYNFLPMIENDPLLLDKFSFLLEYPELVSFKTRSTYFRTKMKNKINKGYKLILKIDSNNILSSSYQQLTNQTVDNLLRRLYIEFSQSTSTIDMGGPKREWFTKLAKEIFNQNYGLFDCLKSISYQPSSVSYIHDDFLQHYRFVGIFIARALIEGQCIDAHLTTSFLKQILHREPNFKDLQDVDQELFNSLNWMLNNDVEPLEMYFEIDKEEFGVHKTIPLKENGSEIKVTNENKKEFVYLNSQFALQNKIEMQVNAFCEGFDSLISNQEIKYFSPNELDLLICGLPDIDADDFISNCVFEFPYSSETPVVKMFFNVIKKWDNENLAKLLLFMTGSSRIPANGFKEFCEMSGYPLKIAACGNSNNLPQAHTCFNTIDLPPYESEKELNKKLLYAIHECNEFCLM